MNCYVKEDRKSGCIEGQELRHLRSWAEKQRQAVSVGSVRTETPEAEATVNSCYMLLWLCELLLLLQQAHYVL